MRDPYEVLGLSRDAGENEIKAAYRRAAKQLHPDVNKEADAAERFQEVSQAYEALTKPQPEQPHYWGFDPNDDFQRHIFEQMTAHMREQQRRSQNPDLQTNTRITLEDAYRGCEVDVEIHYHGHRRVRVKIPPGISDGQRVRVQGAGVQTNTSFPPGDLYVVVHIEPHMMFARFGDDLVTRVRIDSLQAILGKTERIRGLDGTELDLVIPPGVQFGDRLRINGHGMQTLSGGHRGNLICEIITITPTTLTEEHRNLVNQIADLLPTQGDSN